MASAAETGSVSSPSESEHERLFQHSLDLLCVAGIDGWFRRVNPSWTRVLGWSAAELLSRPVIEFVHPEDRERTLLARRGLADGTQLSGFENRYLCKDGSYRWLSWQSSVEPGGATVFGVARDITERRRADHEQFIVAKLESASVLAAGLAHDFNNLLASMLLNLEMVALGGPVSERQRRHLQQALDSVQSAQALTSQLVAFAQGGASVCARTQLAPVLREAIDGALSGSNLRADCRLADDLPAVDVDPVQLTQALRNVLLNAREAMPEGGVVEVRAERRSFPDAPATGSPSGDYVRISVRDQGPGMPADTLAKVFDPYYSTKQRGDQKGMGLGLTICRTVFQKHGGFVTIESEPGAGTTVHGHLPIPVRSVQPEERSVEPKRTPVAPRVLVLEDDPNLQGILEQTLIHLGYGATVVGDGASALKAHAEAAGEGLPFDVLLLDLTVRGGLGGQEVLARLQKASPDVRAVLMTGYTHEAAFRDFSRHGFKAALAKPFPAEALRTTLARVLAANGP